MQSVDANTPIVVGVDGSETSLAAARWAAVFAGRLAVPMRLVHSSSVPGLKLETGTELSELEEIRESYRRNLLAQAEASVRRWAPDIEVATVADRRTPAEGLLAAAEDAVMIVVGATGAGAVERWLVGSTALKVVNNAHCPVAVWRGDTENVAVDDRPIVAGVDGSPVSAAATRLAFEWARMYSVPLTAVRAWTAGSAIRSGMPTAIHLLGPTPMAVDGELIARTEAGVLDEILAPYREAFPEVRVQPRSRHGSAAGQLLRELGDAQMVIVGSKGWGQFKRAVLGSTSQNLLHRAERPVVVVRGSDT